TAAATPIAQPAADQSAQIADDPRAQTLAQENATDAEPIEDEFVVPAPEEGDEYFEAVADDRRWISYVNPRDEYRDPYRGEGSGKICVTLLNEDGEVVAGESVPNTRVEIPTGETLSWHSEADPIEVEFPLTEHYERPLDSDQFGTSPDLPQGDGYMDSHCIEFHGPEATATISYGEAEVEGEHADRIDVVGYVQKTNTWDSGVDPIAAAEPYEDAGGWTYEPDNSHGQAVVVLQLDPPEDGTNGNTDDEDESNTGDEDESGSEDESDSTGEDGTNGENQTGGNQTDGGNETDGDGGESDGEDAPDSTDGGDADSQDDADSLPGFGVELALAALSIAALARTRR
ncbi:PGF-CTERM sorting domain-containing protein, partial [Natronoarchaeum mannanilyticum]